MATVIDRYRDGEVGVFDTRQVLFQCSRAAKELWKLCNRADVEVIASQVREAIPINWWDRAALRQR